MYSFCHFLYTGALILSFLLHRCAHCVIPFTQVHSFCHFLYTGALILSFPLHRCTHFVIPFTQVDSIFVTSFTQVYSFCHFHYTGVLILSFPLHRNTHFVISLTQVRSCHSAVLELAESFLSESMYAVELGAEHNNQLHVFDNGELILDLPLASLLHCDVLNKFWMAWAWQQGERA